MESRVIVHPRIWEKHGISEVDVLAAWHSAPKLHRPSPRNHLGKEEYVVVGFDRSGRTVELVAVYETSHDAFLVYHGRRPATKTFVQEYERGRGV